MFRALGDCCEPADCGPILCLSLSIGYFPYVTIPLTAWVGGVPSLGFAVCRTVARAIARVSRINRTTPRPPG